MFVSLLLLACNGGGSGGAQSDVVSLRIDPDSASLVTRPGQGASLHLVALATFEDGGEEPLDLVSWESSNVSAGEVDSTGLFHASDTNGGVTTITATHMDLVAESAVTVVYTDRVLDGVDESVATAWEAATPTDDPSLVFTYPTDGVTVPRNVNDFAFSWEAQPDRLWRVHFTSAITDISVYTTGSPWLASSDLWQIIAAANREGEVSAVLESARWDGSQLTDLRSGPPLLLRVHRLDARGSVLYWETTTSSIMRLPLGAREAVRFYPAADSNGCFGCHVISEATQQMVVTESGVNGHFSVLDVANPDTPKLITPPDDSRLADFKALSPDGTAMIGMVNGVATLHSLPDGNPIQTLSSGTEHLTHPDWSPDGGSVVFVRATGTYYSDLAFTGGEIVVYPFEGGRLGTPQVVVARGDWNNYYPTFSPDGQWIAFNRSHGDAYANVDAELWMVRPDGTGLVRLDIANGEGQLRNSYPRWAPLSDDDVLWLAFSSSRAYPPEGVTDVPQIWVTAVDEAVAAQGADPSAPPFWLPGQDASSNNHLPVWWSR